MIRSWRKEGKERYTEDIALPASYAMQIKHRYGGAESLLDEWWDMLEGGAAPNIDKSTKPCWQTRGEPLHRTKISLPYRWMDYLDALCVASDKDLGAVLRCVIEERNTIRGTNSALPINGRRAA